MCVYFKGVRTQQEHPYPPFFSLSLSCYAVPLNWQQWSDLWPIVNNTNNDQIFDHNNTNNGQIFHQWSTTLKQATVTEVIFWMLVWNGRCIETVNKTRTVKEIKLSNDWAGSSNSEGHTYNWHLHKKPQHTLNTQQCHTKQYKNSLTVKSVNSGGLEPSDTTVHIIISLNRFHSHCGQQGLLNHCAAPHHCIHARHLDEARYSTDTVNAGQRFVGA